MSHRGPPENLSELVSLKVDNLPDDVVVADLREVFEKFGTVADVYIPMNYNSRTPKSFGFVRFTNKDDADAAVRDMNGYELRGSRIGVQVALHPRPDRSTRRPRRSRSRSYGRRRSPEYSRSSRRSRSRSRDYRRGRSRSRSPAARDHRRRY